MVDGLDGEISKIQITDLVENTFHGRVFLRRSGVDILEFDARPSDALALAIRYRAPIFIRDTVFESAAVAVTEELEDGESGEVGDEDLDSQIPEENVGVGKGIGDPDSIEKIRAENTPRPTPLGRLESQLKKAIENERYEDAAKLRDAINRLKSEN
jgi:bifunctional DNase/RNase